MAVGLFEPSFRPTTWRRSAVGPWRWSFRAPARRGRSWITLAAVVLLLAAAPWGRSSAVEIGGPFDLVDQNGVERTDGDFRGSYMLVYFGYVSCPDLCPTTLQKVSTALADLAATSPRKADRVVPLFITIDPQRDTPAVLRPFAEYFDPRLVTLTGTPKAVASVSRRYGVRFAKVPTADPDSYFMDHTGFVYLMGPDGKYIAHLESDFGVDELVDVLQRQVIEPSAGGS